jgi:hypothetical protein
MHAKYMHELCSLLMHIPTYYNVISCYNNVLWTFSIDPPFLVITQQNRKTLLCVFLSFRNLPELKLTQDFWSVNILSREAPEAQEVNEMRPRGRTSIGGATTMPGRATHARWGLEPPTPSIFAPRFSA